MNVYSKIHDHLFTLMFEIRSRLAKSIKENHYDISPLHHKALAILYHTPDITQQDLSTKTGRDKSQISRLIRELEAKDLIERRQDETDKRIIRLKLNERGSLVFQDLKKLESQLIRSLLLNISDNELEVLDQTLLKLRENIPGDGSA